MKKSLARVKQQLADQLRPGRTDVLSEELQAADKRVEYLREVLQTLSKALPLPANGDKRPKKGPDYNIYNLLKNEKLQAFDEGCGELIQPIFLKYSDMFYNLADEYVSYESEVDQKVATPLHKLLETDISKLKKNLNKYVSDRDSANNRLQTAQNRHYEMPNKHHVDQSKLSSLQDDLEEAGQKVEQASDQLAHDMFTLLSKEPEISNYILLHIKLRRQYYENALDVMNRLIPDIENLINNSEVRPVFNCPLADHLRVTKRKIALPIELCVCAIMEHGIAEEGLFRVAGGASKLRRLKLSIDANCLTLPLPPEYKDIHLFAGVLKSYLRELPEPLLTFNLHGDWIHAGRITNEEKRIIAIKDVLSNLPQENYDNLKYLIKFLSELSKNSQNKMSSHNIAIVMSPNLLWGRQEPDLDEVCFTSVAVDTLVTHADLFFPGETEFYLTYKSGEIFRPDFSNKIYTHTRNSSNDTNVIILDHETTGANYSVENSSPKPVTRRKNKPAPEPPKIDVVPSNETSKIEKPPRAIVSGTATVNRSTYKKEKQDIDSKNDDDVNVQSMNVRRKSLDIDREMPQSPKSNQVKKEHHTTFSKEDISEPTLISNTATTPVKDLTDPSTKFFESNHATSANVNQINAQTVTAGKITVVSENLQTKSCVQRPTCRPPPVAAPRLSLAEQNKAMAKGNENKMTKSLNEVELRGCSETVELRRPANRDEIYSTLERGNKPTIPERPASLRPASFRLNRPPVSVGDTSVNNELNSGVLERTVMYNVPDKQQVSFVQFKDRMPPGHDTQIAEKEKFLGHQPAVNDNFNSQFLSLRLEKNGPEHESTDDLQRSTDDLSTNSLQRRRSVGAKPIRPPKPDIAKSTERLNLLAKSNERLNNVTTTIVLSEVNNSITDAKPSHGRTMSEGNIVDSPSNTISTSSTDQQGNSITAPGLSSITHRPSSPKHANPSRPPRPQPPPPPPPTIAKQKTSESTDL
ncbi:SH3 domain-binding protein 1-like [Chrysoperla carnea]|uniref:SH3 domain-binding protein 1-like n=1 Tax=Chrysoperla carnea TaxID=189513 RepID=UPI001D072566|nr:SH3 domain-binding protein 1-like [Chrysoperla carnea]